MSDTKTLVIVAVGKDKPGLANALTRRIHDLDCTIEETRMETFGDYFPMLLQVAGTPDRIAKVQTEAEAWASELDLDIEVYEDASRAATEDPKRVVRELRVDAVERAGIIDDITHILRKHKSNVAQLEGHMQEMPFSGEYRFVLDAVVEIPEESLEDVSEALDATGMDYLLTERTSD